LKEETGQLQTNQDTDHQTACAFCARYPVDRYPKFAELQSEWREFRMRTVGFGWSSSAAGHVDLRLISVEIDPSR